MKKITLALACASTLALFATDFSVATFEGYTATPEGGIGGKDDNGATTGDIFWLYEGAGDGSLVKAYKNEQNPDNKEKPAGPSLSGKPDSKIGDNYLDLSTEGGTLWRSFNASATGLGEAKAIPADKEGLFIDTMVQFTATEDSQAPESSPDDKLLIWLADEDGVKTLKVFANAYTFDEAPAAESMSFSLTPADGSTLTIEADAWYRLTIKSIANVLGAEAPGVVQGFQIFVDGVLMKAASGEPFASAYKDFMDTYKTAALTDKTVFASLKQMGNVDDVSTLQAVGFKGSGALDDLVLTDENPFGSWAKDFADQGSGTASDPYRIASTDDLEKLAAGVAKGGSGYQTAGVYFKLMADVDLAGKAWTGIGTTTRSGAASTLPFCGVFDGNGKTVSNLTFARKEYNGLFGNLGGEAIVSNLTIKVAGFVDGDDSGSYGAAGAVGFSTGTDVLVQNVTVEGQDEETVLPGTHNIGGIGCRLEGGITLRDCTNKLALATSYSKIGGMCAIASERDAKGTITLDGCVNLGSVTALEVEGKDQGKDGVSGMIGYIQSDKKMSFIDCESLGTLTGTSKSCIASFLGKSSGHTVVEISGNTAKADYLAMASGTVPDGLQLATVADGIATFIKNDEIAAGGSYEVMGGTPAPVIALARGKSITFNGTIDATGITAASADDEVTVAEGVYTCTAIPTATVSITKTGATADVSVEAGAVKRGTVITVTNVAAAEDYENATVTINGAAYDAEKGYTVTGEEGTIAIVVSATAIEYVTVAAPATIENGSYTVTPNGSKVRKGTEVKVVVTPAEGVEGASITINGAVVEAVDGVYSKTFTANENLEFTVVITKPAPAPSYPTYIGDDTAKQAKYNAWAKKYGADTASAYEVAYLLNCDPEKVSEAKAAFVIPAITVAADGKVTVTKPAGDFNGTVEIKGCATLDGEYNLAEDAPAAKFFKAFLK